MPTTSFHTWKHDSLVKFAEESQEMILLQKESIEALRLDLRDAMEHCRVFMRKSEQQL